jgi:hypothetical protein
MALKVQANPIPLVDTIGLENAAIITPTTVKTIAIKVHILSISSTAMPKIICILCEIFTRRSIILITLTEIHTQGYYFDLLSVYLISIISIIPF